MIAIDKSPIGHSLVIKSMDHLPCAIQEWEGLKCEENFLAVKLLGSLLADRREEKLRGEVEKDGYT